VLVSVVIVIGKGDDGIRVIMHGKGNDGWYKGDDGKGVMVTVVR
jgi:hypothetical protein